MNNYFRILGALALFLVLIPVFLGTITVLISRRNKVLTVVIGGFYAQIILGGIGVIIHELSHLLMALLFGHQIVSFRLLHIPNPSNPGDNALGYVNHAWNEHSFYQRVGNVFIGIAPVVGCTLAIIGLTQWLVPGIFELWQAVIAQTEIPQIQLTAGCLILWLILIANIAIGGFDLSSADLENSATGLMMLLAVFLITALILSQFTTGPLVAQILQNWLAPFYWSMIFALLINLLMLGILSLLSRLG
ncbi:hypothetical protein ACLUX0_02315 [Limosilactobacillus mucosae]